MPERHVTVMRLDSEEQARFFQEELENAGIQAQTGHDPISQPKQEEVLPLTGGPVVLMVPEDMLRQSVAVLQESMDAQRTE